MKLTKYGKTRLLALVALVLAAISARADVTVTGTVIDDTFVPVAGAAVAVKGSPAIATVTDIDGNFTLSAPSAESVLLISFIGYQPAEAAVPADGSPLQITLHEDAVVLGEVVAVGYATVKKSDLTGSVEKVDMDQVNKAPVTSFDQALGGRVAGLYAASADGRPGETSSIVIRGSNTVSDSADGSPLFVIDGFATDDPNTASINPADIESIDVLKDASATAIYGARGANGVIIITTKRGIESAPRISYDGYVALQTHPEYLELLQGRSYVELQQEILTPREMMQTYFSYDEALGRYQTIDDYNYRHSNNWQEMVFRNAMMTSHNLGLTGGTQRTRYSASLNYLYQDGTLIKSSYQSLKARATLDQQISPTVKFGTTINFSNNLSKGSAPSQGDGQTAQYLLYQVLAYRPLKYRSTDDLENIEDNNGGLYPYNPLKTIENSYNQARDRQLTLNAYLNWNITKELMFKVTFAYTWRQNRTDDFYNSKTHFGDPSYSSNGTNGSFRQREWNSWSNEYTLNYRRRIGSHNFNVLGGASILSQEITNLGSKSAMIPWDNVGFWGISQGQPLAITSGRVVNRLVSGFARANYDWKGRYLATATFRADGSSKFPDHKWGFFPSASVAWRISDEAFMARASHWLANLKLRLGWGATGNNATYNAYPSMLLYSGDINYAFNNELCAAIYMMQPANRNLKWETTYQTDLGLDFGLFGNRINGTVDLYHKDTRDLLLYADTPGSSGFTQVQQNVGSITNSGLEFTINATILPGTHGRLKWTSSFNIAFNKNKVTALSQGQQSRIVGIRYPQVDDLYICKVGSPLSEMYGYVYDGVYQYSDFDEVSPGVYVLKPGIPNNTNERANIKPGDPKLKDINGDGKVTAEDRTVIGHGLPIHTGGFTNTFEWKGFDLSIFLQWTYGNDVINYNRVKLESLDGRHINQLATAANHWRPQTLNPDGTVADPGNPTNYLWAVNRGLSNVHTSREVEDASFLRIKNVQLGYSFPAKVVRRLKLASLRIYAGAQNLYTFTKYSGYDPEVSTRNSAMTRGFDYSAYPRAKTFTFGLSISL